MTAPIGPLTEAEVTQIQRLLSDPLSFPSSFKQWVTQWVEANPPSILTTTQGTALQVAQVTVALDTSGSLAAAAHAVVTAPGPALSGLVAGKYILLAGFDSAGLDVATMTMSTGGVITANPRAFLVTLGTSVSTTLDGTGSGVAGSIFNCWLLAIRYSA